MQERELRGLKLRTGSPVRSSLARGCILINCVMSSEGMKRATMTLRAHSQSIGFKTGPAALLDTINVWVFCLIP
jgi:hypothetical protein